MVRPLCLLLVLLAISFQIKGQDLKLCPESPSKKAVKLADEAKGMIKSKEDYSKTKETLLKCLQEDSTYAFALSMLGDLAFSKKDWPTMKDSYRTLIRVCPDADAKAHFRLGTYLYETQKIEECIPYLKSFLTFGISDERMNKTAESYVFRAKMILNPVPFNPTPVKGISTADPEYLASISPDDETFFFTRRFDESRKGSLTPISVEKFMIAKKSADGLFNKGEPMPLPFNSANNNNEGGPAISKDNRLIVFTRNLNGNFDLCYSEKNGEEWSEIQNMGANVNDPKQWDSQPTLSSDGRTIYFASYRDSVYGTSDIFMTKKNEEGFTKAVRMPFNTSGNEKSPFIHPDNSTFYFSSDSLPGMGGFDIFLIKKDLDGKWTKPVNLGYPINTENDEVGFFVSTDGKTGYFASNKLSGTGGYDIFSFEIPSDKRPEKVLFVKGRLTGDNDEIPTAAKIELKNIRTSEVIDVSFDTITGHYASVVKLDSDYIMTVKSDGAAYSSRYFETKDTTIGKVASADIEVKKLQLGEPYNLNDILFATNSSEMNFSTQNIVKDFADYLKQNKTLKVAIHGHTDNAGDPNKNMELSQARAKAVYDLLIREGVSPERLNHKGFGQTKPVADNNTPEGMSKNRRTEFVVTSK
ncbi:MAG: OmpA family protein [Bacteroidota bacterium]|jgi:outer membrane protein OmpA-like peptidoglycan-associated protein